MSSAPGLMPGLVPTDLSRPCQLTLYDTHNRRGRPDLCLAGSGSGTSWRFAVGELPSSVFKDSLAGPSHLMEPGCQALSADACPADSDPSLYAQAGVEPHLGGAGRLLRGGRLPPEPAGAPWLSCARPARAVHVLASLAPLPPARTRKLACHDSAEIRSDYDLKFMPGIVCNRLYNDDEVDLPGHGGICVLDDEGAHVAGRRWPCTVWTACGS